jgi:hypothetical protein
MTLAKQRILYRRVVTKILGNENWRAGALRAQIHAGNLREPSPPVKSYTHGYKII